MSVTQYPHEWSNESLIDKAQRYAKVMLNQDRTDWQFGFWAALTLEMLARAALAKVSPTLLGEGKDWSNTYYALGYTPTESKFTPKSIGASEVFKRLRAIVPEFTDEVHNFSSKHINWRNSEFHSGSLPFDSLGTSAWLPNFYHACQILLQSQGEELSSIFGSEEENIAIALIKSLEDKTAKAVEDTIKAYRADWDSKSPTEMGLLTNQATALSSRHLGHGSNALLAQARPFFKGALLVD